MQTTFQLQSGPAESRPEQQLLSSWTPDSNFRLDMLNCCSLRHMQDVHTEIHKNAGAIEYFLDYIVFPESLRFQSAKLTAGAHELGGCMLFTSRYGFSGTPSILIPAALGSFEPESGSLGMLLAIATDCNTVSVDLQLLNESVPVIDTLICASKFSAFIDAGATMVSKSNLEAARILLENAPASIKGVLFLDSQDKKSLLFRGSTTPVLEDDYSGISPEQRITYYDHSHTRGTDILQHSCATALVTVNSDMTLSDYLQAIMRLRRLGKGQKVVISLPSSLAKKMETEVGKFCNSVQEQIIVWFFINGARF